jgi:hypothetical protein
MSYDMIDRFLRNNLGDDDYAEYSAALDELCTQPRQPLTDEQIEPIAIDVLGYGALRKEDMELFTQSVRAIEAAHGINPAA